jgi:hypothetical protein
MVKPDWDDPQGSVAKFSGQRASQLGIDPSAICGIFRPDNDYGVDGSESSAYFSWDTVTGFGLPLV